MTQAATEAENLLKDFGLDKAPIIPEEVCKEISSEQYQVTIQEKSINSEEFYGISIGDNNGARILINANIANPHRKKFTAAHEIGHVVLHIMQNKQSKFECTPQNIYSNSNQNNEFEKEANEFASALLMPRAIILSEINKHDLSWSLIKQIQTLCDVSLEAAARRVVNTSKDSCCLIMHKDNQMWLPIKSNNFKTFVPRIPFPKGLYTDPDNNQDNLPDNMVECDCSDWLFPDNCTGKLFYSSIRNSEYNRTMTLLLYEEDEFDDEQEKDEPRFA